MYNLDNKIKQQYYNFRNGKDLFRDEDGAIDLASIMVGVIVIGLIGGVIAATVFAVIPWSQDNAAKQQLDSIVQAENAYFGLSAANPSPLPTGYKTNSFGKSAELQAANLLTTGPRYCVTTPDDSKSYTGYSQSGSGAIFTVTDKNTKPEAFVPPSGKTAKESLPADCQFITEGMTPSSATSPIPTASPYVDPAPTTISLTYKCDSGGTAYLPMNGTLKGTLTWSDGSAPQNYNYSGGMNSKSLTAGVTYTATYIGTFTSMTGGSSTNPCLRSVDHWGTDTGVTSARMAFRGATNLTSVPDHIPNTITDMSLMFQNNTSFNDSNISQWDVSNVVNMTSMFIGATNFNQPLNNWNVSKVVDMSYMFQDATSFNQPLNNWNTSSLGTTVFMFDRANAFNQDLSPWNMSNVKSMAYMFGLPHDMKNNVNYITAPVTISLTYKCDTAGSAYLPMNGAVNGTQTWSDGTLTKYSTSNGSMSSKSLTAGVTYTATYEGTFTTMTAGSSTNPCLRSVDVWGPNTGTTSARMGFRGATNLTSIPASIPKTITDMSNMFQNATNFNDANVLQWDVSKVTNMSYMFQNATTLNQDLKSSWNTTTLNPTNGTFFAPASFPDAYMPANTSK